MTSLTGEEYVVLLSRTADLKGHRVTFCKSTEEAIQTWDWTARSSRIFALDGASPPDFSITADAQMYFVGPIDPSMVSVACPAFLCLGAYNLILVAATADQKSAVSEFFASHGQLRWEKWQLAGSIIHDSDITYHLPPPTQGGQIKVAKGLAGLPSSLAAADEENRTLLAATIAKAGVYMEDVAEELQTFADNFRTLFDTSGGDVSDTLPWLVTVNAHLSRYSSQTFSGVSPITGTECHFWTHSLLGVGMATQALVRIRRFIERSVGDIDWMDKLQTLKQVSYADFQKADKMRAPLYQRPAGAVGEWQDLEDIVAAQYAKAVSEDPEPRLPLIVCFSGRDGFRSTQFSLSAPLEVISGCNTFGWSPMTLTHEVCHVWVTGFLGTLFQNLDSEDERKRLGALFNGERAPANLFEELQLAMNFCIGALYREIHEMEMHEAIQETWFEVFEAVQAPLNELLTHVMDYQLFFHRDDEKYVRAIWLSWDTIPNIKHRLGEYILRSASALLSGGINNSNSVANSLNRLEQLLTGLQGAHNNGRYLTEALAMLQKNRTAYMKQMQNRVRLVRLVRTFVTDETLALRLQQEKGAAGGPYAAMKIKDFTCDAITNPLRFVLHFANNKEPDRVKAAWMLTKLAFAAD